MEMNMHPMMNLADILEQIQVLSQHGIHFTHKHRNTYYFEIDKQKQFQFAVSIQSLMKEKHETFLHMQNHKVDWNPFSSWFMKFPAFCYSLEMYKTNGDTQNQTLSYNMELKNVSNTICEATMFGVETLIYVCMFFCFPAYVPNVFLYYISFLFINILLNKWLSKIAKKHLQREVQEKIEEYA